MASSMKRRGRRGAGRCTAGAVVLPGLVHRRQAAAAPRRAQAASPGRQICVVAASTGAGAHDATVGHRPLVNISCSRQPRGLRQLGEAAAGADGAAPYHAPPPRALRWVLACEVGAGAWRCGSLQPVVLEGTSGRAPEQHRGTTTAYATAVAAPRLQDCKRVGPATPHTTLVLAWRAPHAAAHTVIPLMLRPAAVQLRSPAGVQPCSCTAYLPAQGLVEDRHPRPCVVQRE